MIKKLNLKTTDGVKISGKFFSAGKPDVSAVVLLHMMPSTKDSWNEFAKKLNENGFQCLAIDLRGHGESENGPDGFQVFNDQEHRASINDVESAVKFFLDKNVSLKNISLIGASIGANLALQFQVDNPEIKASVLLSPGLNYKGIETEQMVKCLNRDQAVFFAAGGMNDEYSSETVQKLFNVTKSENKVIQVFKNAGHGTAIFMEESGFMDDIINWLKRIYL